MRKSLGCTLVGVLFIILILLFKTNKIFVSEINDYGISLFDPNLPHYSEPNSTEKKILGKQRQLLGFLSYRQDIKDKWKSLIQRKAKSLDQELLSFLREVIERPAPRNAIRMSRALFITPQAKEIDKILNNKKNGFFIEAGGLDGERSSNTIYFEKVRKWTGLLIEPDPYFYTQLVGKNRHSWSINGCISPYDYVSELVFEKSLGGSGKLKLDASNGQFKVPCYPLLSILTALGVNEVDFFSLDVEGVEGVILESLPFDKLNIKTLAVEYAHGDKQKYIDTMEKNGYIMTKDLIVHEPNISLWVDDFIFVKKPINP